MAFRPRGGPSGARFPGLMKGMAVEWTLAVQDWVDDGNEPKRIQRLQSGSGITKGIPIVGCALRTDAPWIGRGFPGRAWCAMRTLPFDQYRTPSENAVTSPEGMLSVHRQVSRVLSDGFGKSSVAIRGGSDRRATCPSADSRKTTAILLPWPAPSTMNRFPRRSGSRSAGRSGLRSFASGNP
jgi:hypothetical protein